MAKETAITTRATTELADAEVAYALHHYDYHRVPAGFGVELAESLGVDAERVFRTIIAEADGHTLAAVIPASTQLDVSALAAAVGAVTAQISDKKRANKVTGYDPGGVSPLGLKPALSTIVDMSILDHQTVYISAGLPGYGIELAPDDLLRLTKARTAPLGVA